MALQHCTIGRSHHLCSQPPPGGCVSGIQFFYIINNTTRNIVAIDDSVSYEQA